MEYLVIVLIVMLLVFMISAIYYMNVSKTQKKELEESKTITYTDPDDPALRSDEEGSAEPKPEGEFPYLLTQSVFSPKEKLFYQTLKPIADELGLIVFAKMRIADLLYVPRSNKEYIKWFNYIKAKHIDFILVSPEMKVKLLIEVDDKSHNGKKRQQRDEFVDKIFMQHNINILHVWSWGEDLKSKICEAMTRAASPAPIAIPADSEGAEQ